MPAQRPAARIGAGCPEACDPARETRRKSFKEEGLAAVPFDRGHGCPACRHTGHKGRVAFHELLLITEESRRLIAAGRRGPDISRAAAKVGERPLRYDRLQPVRLGLTTIGEIARNISFAWAT